MCPMLLMTKAVKTKRSDTIGKGVAVRTISARGEVIVLNKADEIWDR